ncbi:MAG: AI-2E family transporter [Woeseiaceae bacterium]|nr:AI-2E family transporter [Woeseiaceae bacterium]NIP21931.1 AI-2E family transporter [Woeseiaceae bacterium]NIS91016.1 AI-2E family transporter [Woeseiaceae bacterium]
MNESSQNQGNAVISFAAVIIIVIGLQMAKDLLVPFLVAVFLALITVRPMLWMQKNRVPAVLAVLIIVSLIMLILAVLGTIVGASIAEFTAAMPSYQQRLDVLIDRVVNFLSARLAGDEAFESLGDVIDPGWAMGLVAGLLNSLKDVLTNIFLIIFTMIFILLEASTVETKIAAAFGRSTQSLKRPRVFLVNLGSYLGIKTIVSMVTGLAAGLLTWALGVDFPLLWAMLAFLLNYIPTIGSIIAAVPAVLIALVQLGVGEATATAIGFVAINMVFGNIIEPRMMGHGVGISPLIVFIGLFFWGWVFGPVGMLLSVPLTMTLKLALESDKRTRWVAILIGSERDADYALRRRRSRRLNESGGG